MLHRNVSSLFAVLAMISAAALTGAPADGIDAEAAAAFDTVYQVFQHPRCSNCHISGEAPLQFGQGLPHAQMVVRGPEGKGAPGMPCATCHGEANPPASYGPQAPPGAPHWSLPPPNQKMAWIDASPHELCERLKDPGRNGNRDLPAILKHVRGDALVLWGWEPGGDRVPVPVPHPELVAHLERWIEAGAPCPPPAPRVTSTKNAPADRVPGRR